VCTRESELFSIPLLQLWRELIKEEEMSTGGQTTLNPQASEDEVRNHPRLKEALKARILETDENKRNSIFF
jgi:hypothetical protein